MAHTSFHIRNILRPGSKGLLGRPDLPSPLHEIQFNGREKITSKRRKKERKKNREPKPTNTTKQGAKQPRASPSQPTKHQQQ
jgi:CO/xanthine dehydrogenase Mo-binding subunit